MDQTSGLLKGELIGREILLIRLSDRAQVSGKIIDETKNTIVVRAKGKKKRLIKALYAFEFMLEGRRLRVDGRHFQKKPEERIKLKMMKKW